MSALSERLQREAPSRELDVAIHNALATRGRAYLDPKGMANVDFGEAHWPGFRVCEAYCNSLDAALTLFREVLPGWIFELKYRGVDGVSIEIEPTEWSNPDDGLHHARRPDDHLAMALCAAICRAKGL